MFADYWPTFVEERGKIMRRGNVDGEFGRSGFDGFFDQFWK
jgi:hypothetical protein